MAKSFHRTLLCDHDHTCGTICKSGVSVAEDSGYLSLMSKKVKYDTTAQVEAELLS